MNETKAYLRLFRPDPADLTARELGELIDLELEKEEPDADLIELCLDALSARKNVKAPTSVLRYRAVRIALAAALSCLLLFGAAAAAGQLLGFDLPGGIVEFFDDRIRIHTGKSANTVPSAALPDAALAEALSAHGLADVHLPAAFFAEGVSLGEPGFETQDFITSATVPVSSKDLRGTIVLTRYADGSALPPVDYPGAAQPQHIVVSGIDVFVFGNAEGSVITYTVGRTVYTLALDCGAAAAAEIAATVK